MTTSELPRTTEHIQRTRTMISILVECSTDEQSPQYFENTFDSFDAAECWELIGNQQTPFYCTVFWVTAHYVTPQ